MVWIWLSLFLNSSQIKQGKKRKPNQQHGTRQKVLCFSSPISHRFTAYPNCAPAETKKKQKGSCCTSLEAQSCSSSIYKLWHMLALAMKGKIEKKNRKRERQEGKEGKVASRKASAGSMRLVRLSLMQQLAVVRMMRSFCHTLPVWPVPTSPAALSSSHIWLCSACWGYPARGTEVSGIKKFHTGFPSSSPVARAFPLLRQKSNWQAKDNPSLSCGFAL